MICDKEGPTKWEDALSPSNKTEFCYRIQNKEPRKNIILDSSMVEHSAVNRVVAGSSPARGARAKEESGAAVPKLKRIRLRGQAVKTSPFHGGNTGSIPVGVINWDLSSAGRASALQAEGHRFEPCRSHLTWMDSRVAKGDRL